MGREWDMTIETKFNIGDSVWTIREGKAVQVEILGIEIKRGEQYDCDEVDRNQYRVKHHEEYERFWAHEDACHATKEELIASL